MKTRYELRLSARETLNGHWGMMILAVIVYEAIAIVAQTPASIGRGLTQISSLTGMGEGMELGLLVAAIPLSFIGIAIAVFLGWPLAYGFEQMPLRFDRNRNIDIISAIFLGFKDYWRSILLSLLSAIYVILWTFLLIVPGIIKACAYSMSTYLALDHPDWDAERCIHESRMMMRGHKWQLFVLDLSFIGWTLLCILTLGIGFLWLIPYINQTHVKFYNELVADQQPAAPVAA